MRVALVRMVDAHGADRQDSERDQREREKKAGKTKTRGIPTVCEVLCNVLHDLEINEMYFVKLELKDSYLIEVLKLLQKH